MAANWIKMRVNLHDDPRVFGLAKALNIPRPHVIGLLYLLWAWADTHTKDGDAPSVTRASTDELVGVTGFGVALANVGWLEETEHGIRLPRFLEHNGQTAKARGLTAKRTADYRARKCDAPSVTTPSPDEDEDEDEENTVRAQTAPDGAERTNSSKSACVGVKQKPTQAEADLYAAKIGLPSTEVARWSDYYDSNGWRVGRQPMRSWQASMRNWKRGWGERRSGSKAGTRVNRNIGTLNDTGENPYADILRKR